METTTTATSTATTASSDSVPCVSTNFPRVPAGCEKAAETFFACFHEHGKPSKDAPDADLGNKALVKCAASVDAYNKCVDKTEPKKLFRVPEAYRMRDE